MSDNLNLWNRFADIDPKFSKPITGKPYKGTSPNPQYVIQCLTEIFGPMGQGFGAHVVSEGFQPLGDEILHWCRIEFWHTDRATTFETYGQTKAFMKTKNGMTSDEDAPKKSFTDALIKAASYVGIASNIFLGRWDDQKYVAEVNAEYRKAENEADAPSQQEIDAAIEQINKANTLEELQIEWKALNKNVKHVAHDERAIKAKDIRKDNLTRELVNQGAG